MSLTSALVSYAIVYLLLHDAQKAQQVAEASICLAAEQGFTLRLALGTYLRGLAWVSQGNQAGIAEMKLGLNGIRNAGSEDFVSYYLAGVMQMPARSMRGSAYWSQRWRW